MWSLSVVMSECFLSGHGKGHMNNFYTVDLENFATASSRYTGDIHNSPVVGLFMTPTGQWKWLDRVMVECTCLLHIVPLLATYSRCGVMFNIHLSANLLRNLPVKKMVNRLRFDRIMVVFGPPCICSCSQLASRLLHSGLNATHRMITDSTPRRRKEAHTAELRANNNLLLIWKLFLHCYSNTWKGTARLQTAQLYERLRLVRRDK